MSKPLTTGLDVSSLPLAISRVTERANAFEGGLKARLKLAGMYHQRAIECQRLAYQFDREAKETAYLLSLALAEKWRLEDAGRGGNTMSNTHDHCIMQREECRAELAQRTLQLGYALESIRQLVELAVATGHDKATAVKVAQRFLADMEGGK
jgi:hypothetical protein